MSTPEIAVCRTEPTITRMGGLYILTFQRDPVLTMKVADETKASCELLAIREAQFLEKTCYVEWELPTDPGSRIVKYMGVPTRYSKIRFGILKALIVACGSPVHYDVIAKAGWGALVDKDVLEDSIYQFNKFFAKKGVPKFIHCCNGYVHMDNALAKGEKKSKD